MSIEAILADLLGRGVAVSFKAIPAELASADAFMGGHTGWMVRTDGRRKLGSPVACSFTHVSDIDDPELVGYALSESLEEITRMIDHPEDYEGIGGIE